MSTRDATYTACVEAMARAIYREIWGYYPEDADVPGYAESRMRKHRKDAEVALAALRALPPETLAKVLGLPAYEQVGWWSPVVGGPVYVRPYEGVEAVPVYVASPQPEPTACET